MKRSLLLISAIAVVFFAVLLFKYRWHKLDYFLPNREIAFAAPFRTMAEHNEFMQDREWPFVLEIDGAESALIYYGSWHAKDPSDPQVEEIKKIWKRV